MDTSLLACYCLANVDFLEAVVPWVLLLIPLPELIWFVKLVLQLLSCRQGHWL